MNSKPGDRTFLAIVLLGFSGCSMTKLAVDTQGDVMALASPVIEEQTDYEVARYAIPSSLVQAEGLLRVSPGNEQLLLLSAKGWGSYAYGFVEDDMQRAELAGDLEAADVARDRAKKMYLKAKGYGFALLEARASGIGESIQRDPDELRRFLNDEFTDKEDAAALFWTGYAWGSAINISRDDPAMIADLAFPPVLVERAVALDETYYNAAGLVFLGVFHSSLGESIGGDPALGRKHFERALSLTKRQSKVVQVNFAESYAVQKQDRALFESLLNEVVRESDTAPPSLALPNVVSKRRAQRLLSQMDDLILPPLPQDAPTLEGAPSDLPGPADSISPPPVPASTPSGGPSPALPPDPSSPAG